MVAKNNFASGNKVLGHFDCCKDRHLFLPTPFEIESMIIVFLNVKKNGLLDMGGLGQNHVSTIEVELKVNKSNEFGLARPIISH